MDDWTIYWITRFDSIGDLLIFVYVFSVFYQRLPTTKRYRESGQIDDVRGNKGDKK